MSRDRKKLKSNVKELELQIEAFKRYLPERVVEKILTDPTFAKVEGEHRLVTILFADISGFTPLSEELSKTGKKGAEEISEIVNSYFTKMLSIVSHYGGTVDKFMGDAILALFGAPVRHEDDPERAVRAALDMQAAMKSFEKTETSRGIFSLQISIGINTGLVVAGNVGSEKRMEYTVMGDNVNIADRLQRKAKPGGILISKTTYEKVNKLFDIKPLKPVRVKGKAELIQIYRVLGISKLKREESRFRDGSRVEMIGREKEIRTLMELLEKVLSGKGQVVSVVGDAGIGKSKLVYGFKSNLSGARIAWLEGRRLSCGSSILYWVMLELLKNFFGTAESSSEKTVKKKIKEKMVNLGLGKYVPFIYNLFSIRTPKSILDQLEAKTIRQNTFDAVKSCLLAESQRCPIILLLEDFHWADNSSLELLQYIAKSIGNSRIFIICVYRKSEQDLSEIFGQETQRYYTELPITRLSSAEIEEFAKSILGISELPAELKELIIERSEGNPLYLEELLNSLIESGILKEELGKWLLVSDISELNISDTVEGIVMARLDRLDEKLRKVLQIASVIGKSFQYRVLKDISDIPGLDKHLLVLQEKEMIHKKTDSLGVNYVFRNLLTQEVAYNSLLIKKRTQLHGRIGQCIEELYEERLEKFYGLLAYHYSHSIDNRKAVLYLSKAGEQAEQMYVGKEALDYYTRALSLLETFPEKDEKEVFNLLSSRGNVKKQFFGNYKGALADFEEAMRLSQAIKDRHSEARSLSSIGSVFRGMGEYEKALSYYGEAINILEEIEDKRVFAGLLNKIGVVYDDIGKLGDALMYYNKSLIISRQINDTHIMAAALGNIGIIYDHKGDYENAIKYYNEALTIEIEEGNKTGIAGNLENIGIVYRNLGEYKKAISYFEKALKVFDEISDKSEIAICLTNIGGTQYKLGRYDRALEYQKRALEINQELGAKWGIANSLDEIGMVYQKQGELDLATHYHERSLEIAREIGAKVIEASALINLGIVQFRLNQKKEAKKLIETGISISEEIGNKEVIDYGKNALREMKNG